MAQEGFYSPLDLTLLTNEPPLNPSSSAAGNSDTAKMAEIDTSAPFESVKEAATRFGGIGFWKPSLKPSQSITDQQDDEEKVIDIAEVKEHALLLEKDLIVKERETLDVLKELESTKNMVEELKRKLQKETSEKENLHRLPSAPGFILLELKQAKLNLSRTTTDLAEIRSIVETYNKRIIEEKNSLEKTRKRLSANTSRISAMEEELTITNSKLKYINATELSNVLKQLNSEAEEYKKTGEAAKARVFASLSEIKQTKTKIKTAESRLYAAKKMKEAARASEVVAMAEIKEFMSSSSSQRLSLSLKAQEAEEASKKRVEEVMDMVMVEKENLSQKWILEKIEKASEEVKSSKRVLEEALNRVESANIEKLGVEEALRKWRSDHKKRLSSSSSSVQNNTKFKNATYPSQVLRKDPLLLDVNGMNMVNDEARPVCRPTMSIGQILSMKLEYDNNGEKSCVKRKVSLGQMLSKPAASSDVLLSGRRSEKENGLPGKRKKFGFGRFSVLVRKKNKRKRMSSKFET